MTALINLTEKGKQAVKSTGNNLSRCGYQSLKNEHGIIENRDDARGKLIMEKAFGLQQTEQLI
jgi:hypothetical protein